MPKVPMDAFMNVLCILKMNIRIVTLSLLLICPFDTQSQSNTDKKNNSDQQNDKQETSYIDVVGPLPYGKQTESAKKEPQIETQEVFQVGRLTRIKELESTYGPYDKSLIRELASLGLEYSEQGKHLLARNAFLRSLEIHRINYGLHNLDKSPIVEQLIIVNRTLEDWIEVDKYYEYLYWLYRRTYGEDSRELIPMLSALITWKNEAIERQLIGDGKALYNQALKASKRVKKIEKQYNASQQLEAEAALTQ
jgi:hypothetical protein